MARHTVSRTWEPAEQNVVQLTGRTTADQIVVFDGPPSLEGQIVPVRVESAHGLTIFASAEKSAIESGL
jgi:hypothetical protein